MQCTAHKKGTIYTAVSIPKVHRPYLFLPPSHKPVSWILGSIHSIVPWVLVPSHAGSLKVQRVSDCDGLPSMTNDAQLEVF